MTDKLGFSFGENGNIKRDPRLIQPEKYTESTLVFIVPVSDPVARDNYQKTIIGGIELKDIENFIEENLKDKSKKKYFDSLFAYMAERISTIMYVDKEYEIKSIDLIEGTIDTKNGKIIRLADMGTGRSQSAYLLARLNVHDNRRIIALFDEVAMMDDDSLQPIYNKFVDLYKKNELIVGMVVQKSKQINVKKIGK